MAHEPSPVMHGACLNTCPGSHAIMHGATKFLSLDQVVQHGIQRETESPDRRDADAVLNI